VTTERLRLLAEDAADLLVMSAQCQDMIITGGDIAYTASTGRFVVMGRRFCHGAGRPMRVASGLVISFVRAVQAKGIDPARRDVILNLLGIEAAAGDGRIDLLFSGGGVIRLSIDGIDVRLEDVGTPYSAVGRPDHDAETS